MKKLCIQQVLISSTLNSTLSPLLKASLSYGGDLRAKRKGRTARPLSAKHSHHIVFKVNKQHLINRSFRHPKNFIRVQMLLKKYAKKFYVSVEQISYQHDHIHILAKSNRRSHFHNFFRVFTGQIAQQFKVTDTPGDSVTRRPLWKHRPFTRIVKGWLGLSIIKNYIQLNEKEVTGIIVYRKERLKGLTADDWKLLWS